MTTREDAERAGKELARNAVALSIDDPNVKAMVERTGTMIPDLIAMAFLDGYDFAQEENFEA